MFWFLVFWSIQRYTGYTILKRIIFCKQQQRKFFMSIISKKRFYDMILANNFLSCNKN